jgi:acyl carrier protein
MENTKTAIRQYILERFLPGTDPAELRDTTPLISGAILDSLATVQLVAFLEEQFGVEIQAHEVSIDYLDTVHDMAQLVGSKR